MLAHIYIYGVHGLIFVMIIVSNLVLFLFFHAYFRKASILRCGNQARSLLSGAKIPFTLCMGYVGKFFNQVSLDTE